MEYKWIVYITVNRCNGKFYIGVHKTINPDIFDNYIGGGIYSQAGAKYLQKKNKKRNAEVAFVNAVVKYGYKNFKRTTIKVFDNEKDAYYLESVLVNEKLIASKQCYNMALGGRMTFNCIEKKVYKFALDGEFLRSYKSIQDAAADVGVDQANIVACLHGRQRQSGGFYWNYEKKFDFKPYQSQRAVCQYTLGGKFIAKWDSIKEPSVELHTTAINRAIRTKNTASGYQWRYFEGSYNDIEPYVKNKKKDGDIV